MSESMAKIAILFPPVSPAGNPKERQAQITLTLPGADPADAVTYVKSIGLEACKASFRAPIGSRLSITSQTIDAAGNWSPAAEPLVIPEVKDVFPPPQPLKAEIIPDEFEELDGEHEPGFDAVSE